MKDIRGLQNAGNCMYVKVFSLAEFCVIVKTWPTVGRVSQTPWHYSAIYRDHYCIVDAKQVQPSLKRTKSSKFRRGRIIRQEGTTTVETGITAVVALRACWSCNATGDSFVVHTGDTFARASACCIELSYGAQRAQGARLWHCTTRRVASPRTTTIIIFLYAPCRVFCVVKAPNEIFSMRYDDTTLH